MHNRLLTVCARRSARIAVIPKFVREKMLGWGTNLKIRYLGLQLRECVE